MNTGDRKKDEKFIDRLIAQRIVEILTSMRGVAIIMPLSADWEKKLSTIDEQHPESEYN